jgi:hypothetical protein
MGSIIKATCGIIVALLSVEKVHKKVDDVGNKMIRKIIKKH